MEYTIEREQQSWGRAYVIKGEDKLLKLPSVTTVLKLLKNPKLEALTKKLGPQRMELVLENASYRGTVMHSMLEIFLLEWDKQSPIDSCLRRAQEFAFQKNLDEPDKKKLITIGKNLFWNFYYIEFWKEIKSVVENEIFLWTEFKGGWAGACDFLFTDHNDDLITIDFKSSSDLKEEDDILNYKLQVSAYMFMAAEKYGKIPKRGEIWIANERTSDIQKFIVHDYEFKTYLKQFITLLGEFQLLYKL